MWLAYGAGRRYSTTTRGNPDRSGLKGGPIWKRCSPGKAPEIILGASAQTDPAPSQT